MSNDFHPDTHPATADLMNHVLKMRFDDLSDEARHGLHVFVLDTLGVMVSGTQAAFARELESSLSRYQYPEEASVPGTGSRTSAATAAMKNAFHAHCQEFDCVHEAAVVHALATVQPAVMAWCEREGGVNGKDFMTAVSVGVDVATTIGMAATETLRFFRPATAGIFGATAAIARLSGLRGERFASALGLALAHCSGTMQPHDEGLSTLALQVALAAKNAIEAVDMANAGLPGPQHWLEGPNGYLRLFERAFELEDRVAELATIHRITEVSHKPFPSGRATHGCVDGLLSLRHQGIDVKTIEKVDLHVPPLIQKLVGRPIGKDMSVNYARLCLQYVGALTLMHGTIEVTDYTPSRTNDPELQALGAKLRIIVDDNPDPNALGPQRVVIHTHDGRHETSVQHTLGSPDNPLDRDQHIAKFRGNWRHARLALDDASCDRVIEACDNLEALTDVRKLTDLFKSA